MKKMVQRLLKKDWQNRAVHIKLDGSVENIKLRNSNIFTKLIKSGEFFLSFLTQQVQ